MSHRVVRVRCGIEISLLWLAVLTSALQAQTPTSTISTAAGGGNSTVDGVLATSYRLFQPSDVAIDSAGNFYIADNGNHKIMKVDRITRIITTVAGDGTPGDSGDGGPATSAKLDNPIGIGFDPISGDLFISDTDNARIRRVHNGTITTYAGTGVAGYNGDNILATEARLNTPYHICFDHFGNLYIASSNGHRIRMVNTAGIITTVAGTGNDGYNGDNQPATSAQLKNPRGVLVDSSGSLYIADYGNHRIRVVRGGNISTYAGTGKDGTTGDGDLATSAQLKGPDNLGMDAAGNLYIADDQNHKVRQVNQTTNIINTVAGNGDSGYSGDGGPAVDAAISRAFSATFDQQGRMYIASFGTDVVRVVNFAGTASSVTVGGGSPQSAVVNTAFPQRLTAVVKDSHGTGVSGISVSFSAPGSGASATLSTLTAVTDVNGEASVAATANGAAGSYVVNATATGVSAPAAFNLTNTASAVSQIAFEQQPKNSQAGASITPAVTVRVRDTNGNPISGASVSVSLLASPISVHGTQPQLTDTNGLATFSDLRIEVTGTHTLLATASGLSASSASFQVTAASASHVDVFFGGGQSAYVTTSYTDQLKAKVTDTYGNAVSGASVTFVAPNASGPSVVFAPGNPVVTTGTDGIATSPTPVANSKAGTLSVSANISGSTASFALTNLPGEPDVLVFEQQPSSPVTAGATMTPPIAVRVTDAHGNPALAGVPVTMSMTGPSQSLTGGLIATTNASGLATFPTLSVLVAGANYQLVATAGTRSAMSNAFTVVAGAPHSVEVVIGTPQSAAINTTFAVPLRVLVRDGLQNAVTGVAVHYTAPGAPGPSGLFGGSPTKSVPTDATGRAETAITANSTAGSFTVTAAVAGVPGVTFSLTNTSGAPQTLIFTQQPPAAVVAGTIIAPTVKVRLADAGGNPLSGVSIVLTPRNITLGIPVEPAFTASTDSTGVAAFSTFRLDLAGLYELDATGAGTEAVSSEFQVTPGAATTMAASAGGGQSAVVGSPFAAQLQAIVTDSFTNPVPNVPVTFEVISGTAAGGTFGIPATVTTQSNGIATAPVLTANTAAGAFRVRASVPGMPSIQAEFNLTNTPGAAIPVFVDQPIDTTAGASMPPITVQLQDQFHNPIRTQGVPVTLHLNAPPSSQLGPPPTISTDSSGIAKFDGYSVDLAGVYVLEAQAPAIPSGISRVFTIMAGPAAAVSALGGTPQSTSVGTAFALPLVALVKDALSNPVNAGVAVTFTVNAPASGAGGTFNGTSTVMTNAQGLAASPTLTANTTAGTFTVTATIGAITATWTLTNVAGPVKTISFPTQPTDTSAGSAINPPVVVKLVDENNNPVNGTPVVLSAQIGRGVFTGTTTGMTNASGEATFNNLILTVSGSYQIEASAAGVLGRSATFSINAKTTNLHMQILGGDAQAASVNTPYAQPLKAAVDDEYGNPVAGASVTFSPSPGDASVTFTGPATVNTDTNGVATSPALTANSVVGPVAIVASTPAAATPVTFHLSNISGAASHLTFTQQPTDATAGAIIAPPIVVQLRDSAGNPVLQGGVAVTVQLNPINQRSASLGGIATQNTTADGTATFATLSVAQSGSYTLLAETPGVQSVASNTFTIGIGSASTITATGGATQSAVILSPFGAPLQVTVRDSTGNGVSGVTVAFAPPTGGPSASLSATTVTTDAAGNAAVTATANATAGSYTVTALASGVTGQATFSLTNHSDLSGSAAQPVFTQQPANTPAGTTMSPVVVKLADAGGTPIPGAAITLSLHNSSVILSGTLTRSTDANGLATFDDLSIRTTGSYQLAAAAPASTVLSSTFQITTASAVNITAFSGGGQSAAAGTGYTAPLKASVLDGFGNPIPNVPVTFSAPASGPSVAFGGAVTVNTDSTGLATSPLMTANTTTGSFQVTATTNGAGAPAAFQLTNTAGTAGRLTFVQHPTDTAAGATVSPAVTVQLLDSFGNPVRTAGVAVTLSLNPVVRLSRTLGGSITQNTDSTGLATFADLSGTQSGAYQLTAQSNALGSATSGVFQITTGPAAVIRSSAGTPQSAAVLTAFTIPLQAAVTDAAGNPVAGIPVVFRAPTAGASGTFGGAATVTVTTDTQGAASATVTANAASGSYLVSGTATSVTGSAAFSLTNTAASTGRLAFMRQPGSAVSGQAIAPAVTVQVLDSAGAPVNQSGIAVLISMASGEGELSGTRVRVTSSSGVATFDDLRIDLTGTKTLRASAVELTPAQSNSFAVNPGAPFRIAGVSNVPQLVKPSETFPLPLQAQVSDAAGNPVGGVSVTFAVPAGGPSGSFAGVPTVTTAPNGIATSPNLIANNEVGVFTATAATPNVVGTAAFTLAIVPATASSLSLDEQLLVFLSEINQPGPPPQRITISGIGDAAIGWNATPLSPWLTVSPANGTTPAQVQITVNPTGLSVGQYLGTIQFTPSSGTPVVLVVSYTVADKPALTVAPHSLIFQSYYDSGGTLITPPPQTLHTSSSSRNIAHLISIQVNTPVGGKWLQTSAAQGQTPGTVDVNVIPTGLAEGIYDGSILFTPSEPGLAPVTVPVTLVVGCVRGGCPAPPPLKSPLILGLVNGASFQDRGAPGAAMTLFGRNLSTTTAQALTYPLPTTLESTTVTVNGVLAPLYYVSAGQINFQLPSGTPAGTPNVVVTVGSQQGSSAGQPTVITAVAPGLFMDGFRAAVLNPDLTVHTAATAQPAGAILAFFITAQGLVSPGVADGTAAPATPLSLIQGVSGAAIGGKPAEVTFAGLAPGFAGLAQINVRIPEGLGPGDHPAFITINGEPSNAGLVTVR